MATTIVSTKFGETYEIAPRFTTAARYVDDAKSSGKRVQFKRTDGSRIAIDPDAITVIGEILAEGEIAQDEEIGEPVGAGTGPFNA